ncbi:MAG: hypothetical protein ACLU9S_24250 [Oscillospiraceae bacterium]
MENRSSCISEASGKAPQTSLVRLHRDRKDGTALSLMDVVCQDDDLSDRVSNREDVRLLRQYIDQVLDPREQKGADPALWPDGEEPLPQRKSPSSANISRSYISRIEKKALEKLRSAFEGKS